MSDFNIVFEYRIQGASSHRKTAFATVLPKALLPRMTAMGTLEVPTNVRSPAI
jgi:hypothetical protein